MLLMIDNYDSFTYNLVQYLGELGQALKVIRNDEMTLEEIVELNPKYVVISPGPGRPENAGVSQNLIHHLDGKVPILGVCLGHQAIGQVFGATVGYAPTIMHGKTSMVAHDGKTVFKGGLDPFEATRYHSLIIEKKSVPTCLEVSAWTEDGIVMGLRHKEYPIEGIQFHPESILTKSGKQLLANFIEAYQ